MNSLLNQREICQAFAEQHGYIIVGQSFDDNISGMSFDRRGLDELTAAVDADMIDAVIVKDLSRLGRHRTQTALFIDYLREHQVRVISATEGVDTFRDEDDCTVAFLYDTKTRKTTLYVYDTVTGRKYAEYIDLLPGRGVFFTAR